MRDDLDLINHVNSISIKDTIGDLAINDNKWDFIFDYLQQETEEVYFEGFRLWAKDDDFFKNIDYLSEEMLVNKNNHFIVLYKLKPGFVSLNRSLLNKMWEYYEYPSIVFLRNRSEEYKLVDLCRRLPSNESIAESINGVFVVQRRGQPDILWIEKSRDMSFPWETTRSPIVVKKEELRPWYEKLLNSLGFYWDVKINKKKDQDSTSN